MDEKLNRARRWIIPSIFIFMALCFLPLALATEDDSYSPSSPFSGIGIIITIWMLVSISNAEKRATDAHKGKKEGVDGWLLFFTGFVFILGVMGIFGQVIEVVTTLTHLELYEINWGLYLLMTLVGTAVSGFLIYSATMLYKARPTAKKLVLAALAVDVIYSICLILIPATTEFEEVSNVFLILGLVWSAILMLYFSTSVRVKNTYRANAHSPSALKENKGRIVGWLTYLLIVNLFITAVFAWVAFDEQTQQAASASNIALTNPPSGQTQLVSDTLEGGHVLYYEFADQTTVSTLLLKFKISGGAASVYVVPSKNDYENLLNDETFNTYENCKAEEQYEGNISCVVDTGGIVIYNSNSNVISFNLEEHWS